MAGRRAANRISGPRSALTDFLASHNISAAQIRDSFEQRARTAAEQNAAENRRLIAGTDEAQQGEEGESHDDVIALQQPSSSSTSDDEEDVVTTARNRKRKREMEREKESISNVKQKQNAKSMAALKKMKQKKKARRSRGGSDGDSDDDFLDSLGADMSRKSKPLPGQFENCEICDKRFTVTAYSKTGPEGGLVCGACGKDLIKDDLKMSKTPKKSGSGKARRKLESNRLDGIVKLGARSLQDICVTKAAELNQEIDEFGDLPEEVLQRLSEIFSKRRVMDSRTLQFFLRPDIETVAIHDCANLEVEDYNQIFAVIPNVKRLILRNACQFKDSVLDYMLERVTKLTHFQVYAANLVSDNSWMSFFRQYGPKLETLKLQWLDATFDDSVVACMVECCPNLERLKLKHCRRIGLVSLQRLAQLKRLKHLSLDLQQIDGEELKSLAIGFLNEMGPQLQTLSILSMSFFHSSADFPAAMKKCVNLSKLRLTDMSVLYDSEIAELFTFEPTRSIPPLKFLDLSGARDMDEPEIDADGNPRPAGVASLSLPRIMKHSGATLEYLNISSCRHISHAAFVDAFGNSSIKYPHLEQMDISFCNNVDTAIIRAIFRSCPRLKKLTAFGCFKIDDIPVPTGVALIGVPKAQDEIVKIGDVNASTDFDFGLGNMAGLVGVSA